MFNDGLTCKKRRKQNCFPSCSNDIGPIDKLITASPMFSGKASLWRRNGIGYKWAMSSGWRTINLLLQTSCYCLHATPMAFVTSRRPNWTGKKLINLFLREKKNQKTISHEDEFHRAVNLSRDRKVGTSFATNTCEMTKV
jgi:hypothetical protein